MGLELIAARAIKSLKASNTEIIPEEFQKAFCKEMKKAGYTHEECDKLPKFIAMLDEGYQKLLKNYSLKTLDELVRFLISQVNRLNPSEAQAYLSAQYTLLSKILKTVKQLRVKEPAKLASGALDKLENTKNSDIFVQLAREWDSFSANYRTNEFAPLETFCHIKSLYLEDAVGEIKSAFEKQHMQNDDLVLVMLESLRPSFTKEMQKELEIFSKSLLNDPMLLSQKKAQNDIKTLVAKRVYLDNKMIKQKIVEIDTIVTKCYARLDSVGKSHESGAQKIAGIKQLIDASNETDFDAVKAKLVALVGALDSDISDAMSILKQENRQIDQLKNKIKLLENELESAKEEAGIDFLTKLLNRKVLDTELARFEEMFLRFSDEYAIVFFDIDFFKKINDTYGHMAGDVVLSSFAQILKTRSRETDIVGRYGGEEFIIAMPKTDLAGARACAEDIRHAVEQTKFMYKESRIDVTVSCGCAERRSCSSLKNTIKASDEQLYLAKQNGRNRVYPV